MSGSESSTVHLFLPKMHAIGRKGRNLMPGPKLSVAPHSFCKTLASALKWAASDVQPRVFRRTPFLPRNACLRAFAPEWVESDDWPHPFHHHLYLPQDKCLLAKMGGIWHLALHLLLLPRPFRETLASR